MTLRRLPATLPLALLVAMLVHAFRFGGDHVLGGENGFELLSATLAALGGLALSGILAAALERPDGRRTGRSALARLLDDLPGAGQVGRMAFTLALGGGAAFGSLEWAEGHSPFEGPWLVPALALVALAVAGAVRLLAGSLVRAGRALAAFERPIAVLASLFVPLAPERAVVRTNARAGRRRGRAPPR